VHLCDYPEVDESLIDAELSADMEALLRLVTLGSAARNSVKIKVRQPLAELKIQPASEAERRAIDRFAEQIREELNVKRVTMHDPASGPLLTPIVKANLKSLGPKFGPRLQQVKSALEAASAADLGARNEGFEFSVPGGAVTIEPGDFTISLVAADGWAAAADRETQAALDTRITEKLALEGLAREIVRHVQDARKKADLEMEDRIALCLKTDSQRLRAAIAAHKDSIAAETLVVKWLDGFDSRFFAVDVKIDGEALRIALQTT
jgi:isoleucyl-tRNA synthetase